MSKLKKIVLYGVGGFFVLGLIGSFLPEPPAAAKTPEAAPTVAEAKPAEPAEVTGDRLLNKFRAEASVRCKRPVEKLAKNDFQWTTSGFLDLEFSRAMVDKDRPRVLLLGGDKIKFQNGFGAWIRHKYICEFDTATREVLNVAAEPGQF